MSASRKCGPLRAVVGSASFRQDGYLLRYRHELTCKHVVVSTRYWTPKMRMQHRCAECATKVAVSAVQTHLLWLCVHAADKLQAQPSFSASIVEALRVYLEARENLRTVTGK